MVEQWYIKHEESTYGPYALPQIIALFKQQKITSKHRISMDQTQWYGIEEVFKKHYEVSKTHHATASAPTSPLQNFAHYQIFEELGRGGMGVVYRAKHMGLHRECAIKVLLGVEEPKAKARFIEEARATSKLQHPHIVTIYETGITPKYFFTMEYISGITLSKWLKAHKNFTTKALRIFLKVCQAMEHAHQHNIIHRDLKPENIMIDKNDEPKVMDFGLAKNLEMDSNLSKTGDILGTPKYMAPELANSSKVDKKCDIYSLGVILYEILTARVPFSGENPMQVLYQLAHEEVIEPSRLNPAIKKDIEVICLKCLNKPPEKRFPSVTELREDIENFLEDRPIKTRPPGVIGRTIKWCYRYPLALIIILFTLSLLFFTGFYFNKERAYRQKIEQTNKQLQETEKQLKKQTKKLTKKNTQLNRSNTQLNRSNAQLYLSKAQIYTKNFQYHKALLEILNIYKTLKNIDNSIHSQISLILQFSIFPKLPILEKQIKMSKMFVTARLSEDGRYIALIKQGVPSTIAVIDIQKLNFKTKKLRLGSSKLKKALIEMPARMGGICFSYDAKLLAFFYKKMVHILNINTHKIIKKIPVPSVGSSLCFSQDNKWLAASGNKLKKHGVFFVHIRSGKRYPLLQKNLPATSQRIHFSPENKFVACLRNGGVELKSLQTLQNDPAAPQPALSKIISAFKFSPDSGFLVYASNIGELYIHSLHRKTQVLVPHAHKGKITRLQFSPQGRLLASGDLNGNIIVWDFFYRHPLFHLKVAGEIKQIIFAKGKLFVLFSSKKGVYWQQWDIEPSLYRYLQPDKNGKKMLKALAKTFAGSKDRLFRNPICVGKKWVIMSSNFSLFAWKVDNPVQFKTIANVRLATKCLISPKEKRLIIWTQAGSPVMVNLDTLKIEKSFRGKGVQNAAMCFIDENQLFIAKNTEITLYTVSKNKYKTIAKESFGKYPQMQLSSKKEFLAVGNGSGMVKVFKVSPSFSLELFKQQDVYKQVRLGKNRVTKFSWNSKQTKLAIGTKLGDVLIWNINANTFELNQNLATKTLQISFSPDDRYLGCVTEKDIVLYNTYAPQKIAAYTGYLKGEAVRIGPDWEKLAFPSGSGGVLLFDFNYGVEFSKLSNKQFIKKICNKYDIDLK